MTTIAILGAGMAGFGAAHRFHEAGVPSILYEKMPFHGGHTASYVFNNGFTFDDGPHISFTADERIKMLFAESVNQEYRTIHARVNNYWRGHWIKHPVQCNLHGIPTDLLVRILSDFVHAKGPPATKISTYKAWLFAAYGQTFAETFPMEYGLKNHTTSAENITIDWLGPRMYRPSLEEVLRGALCPTTPDVHYITEFRYPLRNGFVSFLNQFVKQTELLVDHQLVSLDPKAHRLRFANGSECAYDHVISSIPLPALVPMIRGVPQDVIDAAKRLAWTSVVMVNVGVDRPDLLDAHWTYFYDRDICFTRLSTPHMQSPHNVPSGAGSLQAEIYVSEKYRPLDRPVDAYIDPVLQDLRRCGILREDDRILFQEARFVPYANVIFDLERLAALATVRGYLDDIGVIACGRYGEWGHQWTDESFISGENAAQTVLDRVASA